MGWFVLAEVRILAIKLKRAPNPAVRGEHVPRAAVLVPEVMLFSFLAHSA
jgi:hypothetical protein